MLQGARGAIFQTIFKFLAGHAALLDEAGGNDIQLIVGGVIPQEDIPALTAGGVARVFLSGTPIEEIVAYIEEPGR